MQARNCERGCGGRERRWAKNWRNRNKIPSGNCNALTRVTMQKMRFAEGDVSLGVAKRAGAANVCGKLAREKRTCVRIITRPAIARRNLICTETRTAPAIGRKTSGKSCNFDLRQTRCFTRTSVSRTLCLLFCWAVSSQRFPRLKVRLWNVETGPEKYKSNRRKDWVIVKNSHVSIERKSFPYFIIS